MLEKSQMEVEDFHSSGRREVLACLKLYVSFMFSNDTGDMKHYIFHCTNPKLVKIRKTFTPEIYETFTPYPDVNSINDTYSISF